MYLPTRSRSSHWELLRLPVSMSRSQRYLHWIESHPQVKTLEQEHICLNMFKTYFIMLPHNPSPKLYLGVKNWHWGVGPLDFHDLRKNTNDIYSVKVESWYIQPTPQKAQACPRLPLTALLGMYKATWIQQLTWRISCEFLHGAHMSQLVRMI